MSYEQNKGRLNGLIAALVNFEERPLNKKVLTDLQETFEALIAEIETPDEEETEEETPEEEIQTDDAEDSDETSATLNFQADEKFFAPAKTLLEALELIRQKANVSLHKLKIYTDIGNATWDKILKGQSNIRGATIKKLQKKLCIPDRFFAGINPPEIIESQSTAIPPQKPESTQKTKAAFDPEKLSEAFYDDELTFADAVAKLISEYNTSDNKLCETADIRLENWAYIKAGKPQSAYIIRKVRNALHMPARLFKEAGKMTNDDGSDPSKDIDWINKIKKENRLSRG